MGIVYNDQKKIFHLRAGGSSYAMQIVEDGYLAHLYWGKGLTGYGGSRKIIRKDRGFAPNPTNEDRSFSLDTLPQEYPQTGNGDYRSCAYGIRDQNGSRISDLRYQDHEIADGKPGLDGLPSSFGNDRDVQTLKIHMRDEISGLNVYLYYSVFMHESVITRNVVFENGSSSAITLTKMLSMSLDIRENDFDVLTLYGAHNNERNIDRRDLTSGSIQVESLRGTSSPQQAPFMALLRKDTTEDSGEVFSANFVYSGNFTASAQADAYGNTRFQMGMNPWNGDWLLEPGEKFTTPEVVMVYSDRGLNGMSQTYHSFYQSHLVRSRFALEQRPVLINNWESTFFDFDEDKLLRLADKARDVGIELFVLDDGWFGHRDGDDSSLGDWYTDRKKLPNGIRELSDQIHGRNMKFGIWVEPEMISEDSRLFRKHPEYALHAKGRPYTYGRGQLVLDLSKDEVCRFVIEAITDVIRTSNCDYIKWDMNRHLTEAENASLGSDRQGEVFHRYVLGLYKIMDALTKRFPDVLFESCSSGGGRFDPGMLCYMPQTWCSDNTDAVCRAKIQYATSLTYPPVSMGAHVSGVPNQQTGRITSLKTRENVAMSANFGYELDLNVCSDVELAEIAGQIEFYRKHRNTVQFGKFYRITSPFDTNLAQWNFVSKDGEEILAFHMQILSLPGAPVRLLKLKGLDEKALYRESESGEVFGGDELMYSGISIPLKKEDFRSEMYLFNKITEEENER